MLRIPYDKERYQDTFQSKTVGRQIRYSLTCDTLPNLLLSIMTITTIVRNTYVTSCLVMIKNIYSSYI